MGLASDTFKSHIIDIVAKHVNNLSESSASIRESKNGRFYSITVRFSADSRQQLDAIDQDLSASERVLAKV